MDLNDLAVGRSKDGRTTNADLFHLIWPCPRNGFGSELLPSER